MKSKTNFILGTRVLQKIIALGSLFDSINSTKRIACIRFCPPDNNYSGLFSACLVSSRSKMEAFRSIGCIVDEYVMPFDIEQNDFLALLTRLEKNETVAAVIVQNPIANKLRVCLNYISDRKDLDGAKKGNVLFRTPAIVDASHKIIQKFYSDKDIIGIVGFRGLVGNSLYELMQRISNSVFGVELGDELFQINKANIIISATGCEGLLSENVIRNDFKLGIDIGFHVGGSEQQLGLGDISPLVYHHFKYITPVPGGMGPLQIAILIERYLKQITEFEIPETSFTIDEKTNY